MTLFTIETQEFGWNEVVSAAQTWGEWDAFVNNVRDSLACFSVASQADMVSLAENVRELATSFRYARNLISGEDTRTWLQHWGMSVESWMDCLRGQLLRQMWASRLTEITRANPTNDQEISAAIRNYAVCSGKLEKWTQRLAGHAAVASDSRGLPRCVESSRQLIEFIETEFDRTRRRTMTPKLVATKIADHQLDWIHYDCRYLWFDDERVGREAAWCVNEDGMTLDEVAVSARSKVEQWSFYADEIDAGIRPVFLAARQGDLLGPLKVRAGYPLFSLLRKMMPEADDPHIMSRVEKTITTSLIHQCVNERVKWVARF